MKLIIFAFIVSSTYATKLVPLDVKPGKWKSTVKNVGQDMISALLDNMPDGPQKEQIKKSINDKLKKAKNQNKTYCLTEAEIKNPEEAMKKFTKNDKTKECEMKLEKSTSKNLDYIITCKHQGLTVKSTFKFEAKNPKLMVGNGHIPPIAPGMPEQKFSITSTWIKETCH